MLSFWGVNLADTVSTITGVTTVNKKHQQNTSHHEIWGFISQRI
jgi:hypothetical protein